MVLCAYKESNNNIIERDDVSFNMRQKGRAEVSNNTPSNNKVAT